MTNKTNDNVDVTANSKQIEILKKEFPQCFDKKGGFIAEKLLDIVSNSGSELSKESYSLNWLGKSYARLLANETPRTLLSADTVHNAKAEHENSENLLIKGDNLEVLKHLVHAYSEQVKMIYIDPPYNTGSDGFVYQDDRQFTYQQLSQLAGIDNDEAKRILNFTQSKANSHSAWLTFMYPRLYVARELLRDDGVIFISIDDNEVAQLKILCDEVFGEQNFVAQFVVQTNPRGRSLDRYVAKTFEYIICYAKVFGSDCLFSIPKSEKALKEYNKTDDNGKYRLLELRNRNPVFNRGNRPNLYYPIYVEPETGAVSLEKSAQFYAEALPLNSKMEDGCWTWGTNKVINEKGLLFGKKVSTGSWRIYRKDYIPEEGATTKEKSLWLENNINHENGKEEIGSLFETSGNKTPFDFPKSVELIEKCIKMATKEEAVVLDFFAGSGTTAHAVMQLNAEDGGRRHCISVQIDEQTDPKKEASKKYKTIFDITKARIEKAAAKIKAAHPDYKGDLGFKLFETKAIADSYLNDMTVLSADQPDLPIISTNTGDVLTTWSIYDGIALTQSLVDVDLAGYIAQQHNKICYFMDEGFSNSALVAFLHKLDDTSNNFEVEKVVVYGPHFDSKHQREISESLNQYQNRKDKKISIEFRY